MRMHGVTPMTPVERKSRFFDEMQRARGCAGKSKHADEAGALAALTAVRDKWGEKRTRTLQAYKCRFCGCWHLGRSSGGQR